MSDFEEVIDVGFGGGFLPLLGGVLFGGERSGFQDGLHEFQFGGNVRCGSGFRHGVSE
ncbi:MAG TPA: hypothetical protein VE959_18555 [Bryobacteraceae bacterium]|nr:hypothetical protein [Bryobacteraceae bacterium]